MSHHEYFSIYDGDPKASTDESAPPPVPMASMSKPKFGTDSGGSLGGSATSWYTGGVSKMSNSIGFIVNIRPREWEEEFWIGPLETFERAQHVADAVYQYLGMPPFHFDNDVMTLPAITCIGTVIGTRVRLSTREMCANYVREISRGMAFKPHRGDFIQKVKNLVKHPGFPFLTRPHRDSKASAVPMASMSKPEFGTDSSGNLGGLSGTSPPTSSWRYKGVSHNANKWEAIIRVPRGNKDMSMNKIWLGNFPTPLEAAFAYDVAVMCLGGSEWMLNFHHPIYKRVPRILPDLSSPIFDVECKKVVRVFFMLAKEAGDSGKTINCQFCTRKHQLHVETLVLLEPAILWHVRGHDFGVENCDIRIHKGLTSVHKLGHMWI